VPPSDDLLIVGEKSPPPTTLRLETVPRVDLVVKPAPLP